MPQNLPIVTGADGQKYYDVPGMQPVLVDDANGTKPEDMNAPQQPNAESAARYSKMSPDEQRAMFEQTKAAGKYATEHNPNRYDGQLADVFGVHINPEDALIGGQMIGPNIASRLSAGRTELQSSGKIMKALAAVMKSPDSNGIVSRLMKTISGPSAADAAGDVVRAPETLSQTGTKFGLPDRSPLPQQPRWMVKPPKNMTMDRTDDLAGTIERLSQGARVIPPAGARTLVKELPANMTQTRTDDLIGTLQRILKGVRPE